MSILPIIVLPDALLRSISKPVESVDKAVRKLADDMFETMYDAPGIGLAAIQVGAPVRMLVLDVAKREAQGGSNPQVFINPEVIWSSDEKSIYEEGCLSIPEYYEEVTRPASIRVAYQDIDGVRREIEASGLLATCLQHEIDHLNGVLFIDYLSKLKRDRVTKRFSKLSKREG
jgi:peptide deformylase